MEARRREAAQILQEAIQQSITGATPLTHVLRLGLDACMLADFRDEADWFRLELYGYPEGRYLPRYRRAIAGTIRVEPLDPLATVPGSPVKYLHDLVGISNPAQDEPPRPIAREVRERIEWVIVAAANGWAEQLGDPIPRQAMSLTAYSRYVARYLPVVFQNIVTHVQGHAHETARRLEIALTYGDSVQDVWESYRADVDPALARLGLEDHFRVIREGIQSGNPEQWRAAMWGCRSVLEALATTLWQDQSPTYPPIVNKSGKAMSVTADKPINRLIAYLHYKGISATTRDFLEAELERIVASLHALYDLDSKAHSGKVVDREDALLAVVATYTALGQFARRTDLLPVTHLAESTSIERN